MRLCYRQHCMHVSGSNSRYFTVCSGLLRLCRTLKPTSQHVFNPFSVVLWNFISILILQFSLALNSKCLHSSRAPAGQNTWFSFQRLYLHTCCIFASYFRSHDFNFPTPALLSSVFFPKKTPPKKTIGRKKTKRRPWPGSHCCQARRVKLRECEDKRTGCSLKSH